MTTPTTTDALAEALREAIAWFHKQAAQRKRMVEVLCDDDASDCVKELPAMAQKLETTLAQHIAAKDKMVPLDWLIACDRERSLYAKRLFWLHDCSDNITDAEGCEWGIYRVKWKDGQAVEVWQTNSDFSDLDAEMQRDEWRLPQIGAAQHDAAKKERPSREQITKWIREEYQEQEGDGPGISITQAWHIASERAEKAEADLAALLEKTEPASGAQSEAIEPDMYWDNDDPEVGFDSPEEFFSESNYWLEGYSIVRFRTAKKLRDRYVVVHCGDDFREPRIIEECPTKERAEAIRAARAAQGEKGGT